MHSHAIAMIGSILFGFFAPNKLKKHQALFTIDIWIVGQTTRVKHGHIYMQSGPFDGKVATGHIMKWSCQEFVN